ncbi:MAG: CdaR family protein [Pseudobdellovibrionaceae bacterium]
MVQRHWSSVITDHLGYKVVALLIAVILWLTILGRRDFVLTRGVDLDFVAAQGYVIKAQAVDRVKVKVSGPRTALKKYLESGFSQSLTIDISQLKEGFSDVEIPLQKIDVPLGVKVLSLKPSVVRLEIVKIHNEKENGIEPSNPVNKDGQQ